MATEETNPRLAQLRQWTKNKMKTLSDSFNQLSTRTKRISMITLGIIMATTCSIILSQAILLNPTHTEPDRITLLNDSFMNTPTNQLTTLGKMKGEINGEHKSFHLAMDNEGKLYMNPDPIFSKDSLNKENGWEPITREQLKQFETQLHFIPTQKRSLKR